MSAPTEEQRWRKTPSDIQSAINQADKGVSQLQRLANAVGLDRKFTLDGRLVGDIGELIVFRHFKNLETAKTVGHVHDLNAVIGKKKVGVQVKLRRAAKTAKLEFKSRPDLLMALQFEEDWSHWRVLFNGSGAVVRAKGIKKGPNGRLKKDGRNATVELSLKELLAAHASGKFSGVSLKEKS
jgi:Family of unknown function (DUF6998)